MYADKITKSMDIAINETKRRRAIQEEYNQKHGITPMTIQKEIRDVIRATQVAEDQEAIQTSMPNIRTYQRKKREKVIEEMEKEMKEAAKALNFERAAELRDLVIRIESGRMTHMNGDR